MARLSHCLLVALLLGGCSTMPHPSPIEDLHAAVGDRAGPQFAAFAPTVERDRIAAKTRDFLKEPLSLDAAFGVAILNSPRLQRVAAELAIAEADRAGATQYANPVLSARLLPSLGMAPATLEFGILANIVDLLTQSGREHAATATYDAAKFAVAAECVTAAQEVRAAYIVLVAAQHVQGIWQELADAAGVTADLAARFHDAGNIPVVKLRLEQAAKAEAAAALAEAELATEAAREKLALLMGIDGDAVWRVPAALPSMPSAPIADEGSIDDRLDVQAARSASAAAVADLRFHSDNRLWRQAGLGLDAQREGSAPWALGPQIEVALPIFNQGRPEVARAAAIAVKADRSRAEVELAAASQIRLARASLQAAMRRVARYRDEILPLRTEIVDLKMQEYNRMFVGAFDVLAARADSAEADLGYVKALRGYWLARAALDDALGGGTKAAPTLTEGASP